MDKQFQLRWDEEELARAFKVTTKDIREYLTDGRRVGFIIERRLVWENPGWRLAPSEGAGFDLFDPNNGKWEVRSVTSAGVYFNPSGQVGSGRKFNEKGFLDKLESIEGFILSDIVEFPVVNVYVVPVGNIRRWYRDGKLGSIAKVTREKFLNSLSRDIQYQDRSVADRIRRPGELDL